jgi:hypothetical protein
VKSVAVPNIVVPLLLDVRFLHTKYAINVQCILFKK